MTLPAKYRAFQKSVDAAKARHLYRVSKCFREGLTFPSIRRRWAGPLSAKPQHSSRNPQLRIRAIRVV